MLKVVDSSGMVKNSYYYDPYGLSLNKNETVSNPWQYASGYYDATTGLYKFGTRYYDPQTGRWTQKDPVGGSVGKIGSGNPYVYAGDEPNMDTDASGKFPVTFTGAVLACLAGIVTDLIGLLKDAAAAGIASLIASIIGTTIEATVDLPAVPFIIATAIVGCVAGVVIYALIGGATSS